jgi:uncharacterized repeat protein (TIGR03803 family)
MTPSGGSNNIGTIYKTDSIGQNLQLVSSFHSQGSSDFSCVNEPHPIGASPYGCLIQLENGSVYGLTYNGGCYNDGILFRYDEKLDSVILLHDFDIAEGVKPYGGLTLATDGKFYGMTSKGGNDNLGSLFSFDPQTNHYKSFDRAFRYVETFNPPLPPINYIHLGEPYGELIQASNGRLYGMTSRGGIADLGAIFSYDTDTDSWEIIYFSGINGANPFGSLVEANNGKFYGMTYNGGSVNNGVIFELDSNLDTIINVFNFNGLNGMDPFGSLLQASNGLLYGLTSSGGIFNKGVLFKFDINTTTFTKLHDFNGSNGSFPQGTLIQISNGKIYGVTGSGGLTDDGVLFEFDPVSETVLVRTHFGELQASSLRLEVCWSGRVASLQLIH